MKVQVNHDGLQFLFRISFWGMLIMLIYWGGESAYCKEGTTLVVAIKETGLEVNADKTKYMVMSRDQHAGRSHNVKTDNSSFERAEVTK